MNQRNWKKLIWPTICLAILSTRLEDRWDSTFFKWSFAFIVLWTLGTYLNFFLNGKLTAWMEDEEIPVVPDDFHQFCLKADVSPELKLYVNHILDGGDEYNDNYERLDEEVLIKSNEDAMALCAAFRNCPDHAQKSSLLDLFSKPGSQAGYAALFHLGTPLVHQYLEEQLEPGQEDHDDFEPIKLVRILVAYGAKNSFDLIEKVAHDPKISKDYLWISVFNSINLEDEDIAGLIARFTKRLPSNFACVAFLDWANREKLEGNLNEHPFDSTAGAARCLEYLTNQDPEKFSYAVSATAALPFISHQKDELLEHASRHPDPDVRIESAWAAAKTGDEAGFNRLAEYCRDWKSRSVATRYLNELDRADLIPPEVLNPREEAIGEAANWLNHPNELGEYPDELTIFDHREIHWPPASEKIHATLLKWKLREEEGIMMVGSSTWCFFEGELEKPLEVYGRHCTWEMEHQDGFELGDEVDKIAYGAKLLEEANPNTDWSPSESSHQSGMAPSLEV